MTAGIGLQKDDIGKINILDFASYVAIKKEVVEDTVTKLSKEKIKGKYYRIYIK
jgi:ATP-independent RNA helicase DbpA